MRAIEIGRRMLELGKRKDARDAYTLALEEERESLSPLEALEAAVYLLRSGGKYLTAYDAFLSLYEAGVYREEILHILLDAFYAPNEKDLRKRWEKNRKSLEKYPWLFRRDFPSFEELPLLFFPYDEESYLPFDTRTGEFLPKVRPRYEEITHYFFRDLEKPVLARDIFSQYELEYLVDNVRRSEDIGRENHVYLHYTEWDMFCAWLQVWDLRRVLKSEKAVFLFGEDLSRYPIDFKREFGIDYSQYPVRPVGVREVCKIIWHTQFSTHNGGDFYNEIFDYHPNLLYASSAFMDRVQSEVDLFREALKTARSLKDAQEFLFDSWENPRLIAELYNLKNPTDKDLLVGRYLSFPEMNTNLDPNSRIVPAIFFQPHFKNISYGMRVQSGKATLESNQATNVRETKLFKGFRYVKTFTPVRRFTNSCGATLRFVELNSVSYQSLMDLANCDDPKKTEERKNNLRDGSYVVPLMTGDWLGERVRNRSFMRNPHDRLYRDSVMVRLEDGKLNPEATLTRLAAFLDLPYTESMTYCSSEGQRDPLPDGSAAPSDYNGDYAVGFSLKSVYNTYDEYMDPWMKRYMEYLMRDAYEYFGYDFQVYDGAPVDWETMTGWIDQIHSLWDFFRKIHGIYAEDLKKAEGRELFSSQEEYEGYFAKAKKDAKDKLVLTAKAIMSGISYVNEDGEPLEMIPLLKPDPDLLVKPLYR